MQDALTVYYRLGDEVTITPPDVDGYITPPTQTFVLGATDNEFNVIYSALEAPAEEPTEGAAQGETGELADTGMSLSSVVMLATSSILAGSLIIFSAFKRVTRIN